MIPRNIFARQVLNPPSRRLFRVVFSRGGRHDYAIPDRPHESDPP